MLDAIHGRRLVNRNPGVSDGLLFFPVPVVLVVEHMPGEGENCEMKKGSVGWGLLSSCWVQSGGREEVC